MTERNGHNGRDGTPKFGRNEDFVRRVLGATSGSACRRAEAQLPLLVDGRLQGVDRQLVQAHVEHCEPCRALAVALTWVTPLLPDLAEIDPGPEFTAQVLAQTSRAPAVQTADEAAPLPAKTSLGARIGTNPVERWLAWWRRQVFRPAFAVEFAYAATLVLVLLTALPGAPLKGTPDKTLRAVSAGLGSWPVIEYHVNTGAGWLANRATDGVGAGWRIVTSKIDPVTADWRERVTDTADDRTEIGERFDQTVEMLKDGRLQEATYNGKYLVESVREFWRHWWSGSQP